MVPQMGPFNKPNERRCSMKKIEQKEIDGTLYWVEEGTGNKWSAKDWVTEEKVTAAAATLVNCENCTDCSNCTHCTGCTNCAGCYDCRNSTELVRCITCEDCRTLFDCVNCTNCTQCKGCINLHDATDKLCMADQYPDSKCARCTDCNICRHEKKFLQSIGLDCPDYSWNPLQ